MTLPREFTQREKQVLMSLVREALRKTPRSREKMEEKFGSDFDPTNSDKRIHTLEEVYKSLGGKPENITVEEDA